MNYTEAIYLAVAIAFVVLSIVVLVKHFIDPVDSPEIEKKEIPEPMAVVSVVSEPINVAIPEEQVEKPKRNFSAGERDGLKAYEASLVQSAMGLSSDVMRVPSKPGVFRWQD